MDSISHAAKYLLAFMFVNFLSMLAIFLFIRGRSSGLSDSRKAKAAKKMFGAGLMTIVATAVTFLFFDTRSTFAPTPSPGPDGATLGQEALAMLVLPAVIYAVARAGAAARLAISSDHTSRQYALQYARALAGAAAMELGFVPFVFMAFVILGQFGHRVLHADMHQLFLVALAGTICAFGGQRLVSARAKRWTGVSGRAVFAGDVWDAYATFLTHKGYAQDGSKST